jgi:hypothetical protein
LKQSFLLLVYAAAIYGGAVLVWQLVRAPYQAKREADEERDRMRDETVAALSHSRRLYGKYGSNIFQRASLPVVSRQIGTEPRDVRHKIEFVKSIKPDPHYSRGFQLPAARWDEYEEILAEHPELYAVVEKAYTAAHRVNEVIAIRETRAGCNRTIAVISEDGLDAAYEAAGEALDALNEPRPGRES